MEETLNQLINISLGRDSTAGAVMNEVNRLLDVSLWRDSNVVGVQDIFTRNLCQAQSVANYSLEIPADLEDRISFMSEFFEWIPHKPEVLQKFKKNNDVSAALRRKANDLFIGKRDMQKAIQLYNSAIMFAEPDGEELGLAFANRSALLLEQRDIESALKDIDLAVKHHYPARLMPKLEKRREKCVKMLEDFQRSYFTQDVQSDMAERRKFRNELLKLKNPNPLIPCAENFVEIGHTGKVGRQLLVSEDVQAGTVVAIEQPFTSVNKGLLKFEINHCDHCNKFVKNGIPCNQCVFVLYCSEECRTNAECGHHKVECSCLSSLYLGSIDPCALLAFRVVCQVGPDEFYRLFTTRDPNYFDIKQPFGTEPGVKYESDSYLSVHHLGGHSSTSPGRKINCDSGLSALHLMSVLEARTNFFEVSPTEKTKEFQNFIAALLLRLKETMACYANSISEWKNLQGRTLADVYRLKEEGTLKEVLKLDEQDQFFDHTRVGIYTLGSIMNHSCDGNVIRVFDAAHGTMVLVTTRALKKGEPLTSVYGMSFEHNKLLDRQAHLMKTYRFKCQCVACKGDWPIFDILLLSSGKPEFTCPTCSKKFAHEEKSSNEFLKCVLTGKQPTCGLCAKSYKRKVLEKVFLSALRKRVETSTFVEENRPIEMVETYKEFSAYFQFNIRPPHAVVIESRLSFDLALGLILQSGE